MDQNLACAGPGARPKVERRWWPDRPLCAMVAQAFGLLPSDLETATRGCARAALARQTLMYLARVSCGMTLSEAAALCGRDRTTAAHACRVIEDRRDDPRFDAKLIALETMLMAMPDVAR